MKQAPKKYTYNHLVKLAKALQDSRNSLRRRARLSRNILRRARRATSLGVSL